jgi:hypothetical protein
MRGGETLRVFQVGAVLHETSPIHALVMLPILRRLRSRNGICVNVSTERRVLFVKQRTWFENPHEEVQLLVLAKSKIPGAAMAGLCLFRRTWCNHVAVDLLAVHPRELVGERERFKGLGPCLLWYVAEFAAELEAAALWLEATQNSAPSYERMFELTDLKDLIVLDRNQYTSFRDSVRRGHGLE